MEIQFLHNHPDWSLVPGTTDVFSYRHNPDLTLGPDHEDPTVWCLTDGPGEIYHVGPVPSLVETARSYAQGV